jgi:LuxR family transcriptional regulator, maltose regulon positive regulatory protein
LLDDKVRIPRTGVSVLRRSRVTQLIDQAVRHRVTLLTGPAGAGKTVACASWAAAGRAAWVSVDAGDADPARFFHSVAAALTRAGGITADQAKDLAGLPVAEVPHGIATATRTRAEPAVLVLDNVQELAGEQVLAGLDELIRQAPHGLRLLLSGRCAPAVPLARLRVSGELADIGGGELACTPEEISEYFAMLGRHLGPEQREQALRWTEGWMAGLRLMALGTAASEAEAHAMVADYVWDEVLAPLPAGARALLMRTCLTPTVPVELAQELTGDVSTARDLDQLSRANCLIEAVRPDAEYRYHPMLRAVLNSALRRELPGELPGLFHQVARWHAERGDMLHAEQAAAGTGDWDFGLHLLHEVGPGALVSREAPELEGVLGTFPAERRTSDAVLAVALAAARLWQGDADGALPHLEEAESGLTGLAGDERDAMRLWLAAFRVMSQPSPPVSEDGWFSRYWALASKAHEGARRAGQHNGLGLLWLALGNAALRDLNLRPAREALLHASSQLSAGGSLALRERARSWDAVAAAWQGDLSAASRIVAAVADGPHGHDDELAPILALASAACHLARYELGAAASQLDQADLAAGSAQPAGEPAVVMLTGLLRTRMAIAEGNLAGARGLGRWLTEVSAGSDAVGQLVAVLDAEISLASGERERARAALSKVLGTPGGLTADPLPPLSAASGAGSFRDAAERLGAEGAGAEGAGAGRLGAGRLGAEGAGAEGAGAEGAGAEGAGAARFDAEQAGAAPVRPEVTVCQARLLIADDDDKAALAVIEPLLSDAGRRTNQADRLAALLTAAVAHRRLAQLGEATERLEEALALAEPDEAYGAFVAAGAPIRSVLTVLTSPASRYAAFVGRVLEHFETRLPRTQGGTSGAQLTESELAVLRFLPSHMTNQEIADALFLSINTIKTHLSSVYRKLGVVNRRQAIAHGRRLDLLLAA